MILLQSDELHNHAKGIIHKETQNHTFSLDLTVNKIQRFMEGGALDFGGSEFKAAVSKTLDPEKRNPDDDYGWWELDQGTYRAEFNESLQHREDTLTILSPHEHAHQAGIIINTNVITEETDIEQLGINFQVSSAGCSIKENARFATLHMFAN